jgi:hypothetical protein
VCTLQKEEEVIWTAKISLDAGDPFFLLLSCGGRDSIEGVVALNNASVRLGLTRLDHLIPVVRDEQLKTVLREREKARERDRCDSEAFKRKQGEWQENEHRKREGERVTYWFLRVVHFSNTKILQRDDTPRLLILEGEEAIAHN